MQDRTKIEQIRGQYLTGQITLDQAKQFVQPLLDDMNSRGAKIAKKFGKKYYKLTFNYVFR